MTSTATNPSPDSTLYFFDRLYRYSDGKIEIRTLPERKQQYFSIADREKLPSICIQSSFSKQHVYFGVSTRNGKGGAKENVVSIPALWVDVDFKDTKREDADVLLVAFPLPPSILVMSGNGYHVYWLLKEPLGQKDIPGVEDALKRIANRLRGDASQAQAAAILRVPGTLNHKYSPPVYVELLECNDFEYTLDDFSFLEPLGIKKPGNIENRVDLAHDSGIEKIMSCAFMQRCKDISDTLPEPLWYAMISQLARERGGPTYIHDLSRAYPKYSKAETDDKILHAINDTGPMNCDHCKMLWDCGTDCGVKSPAALGYLKDNQQGLEVCVQLQEKTSVIPQIILQPGGIMQEIMDFSKSSSALSHDFFNLAGAIVTVGSLFGQRIMTETNLRTNIYAIVLGHAGSGKDSPQNAMPALLSRTEAHHLQGPNAVTSDAAILKWLSTEAKARSAFYLDEIGIIMEALKKPNSPAAGVPACLMRLFSGTDRPYTKPYASGEDLVVKWHHMSIYGASTPSRFWSSLTRSEATDGFLARLLVFESKHPRERTKKAVEVVIPKGLVEKINGIFNMRVDFKPGNIERVPAPITVGKTEEAKEFFYDWSEKYFNLGNEHLEKNEGLAAIYGRCEEHAHKLALIHAASLHGAGITHHQVELPSVQWSCALVDLLTTNMEFQITTNLAENEWHSWQQKIQKIINRTATAARPGATLREILRGLQGLPQDTLGKMLKQQVAAGRVMMVEYKPSGPKGGRPTTLYCCAKDVQKEDG
jgi:hypothetical protein